MLFASNLLQQNFQIEAVNINYADIIFDNVLEILESQEKRIESLVRATEEAEMQLDQLIYGRNYNYDKLEDRTLHVIGKWCPSMFEQIK